MQSNSNNTPLILFGCIGIGVILGGLLSFPNNPWAKENHAKKKMTQLIDYIQNDYVEEVNTDSLVDNAVDEILQRLDPHSVYVNAKDQGDLAEVMKGEFSGIGVHFFQLRDTLTIINIIKDGPSAQAGLLAGDRIIKADGKSLTGKNWNTDKLFSKLKGNEGSQVALTIFRKSTRKKFEVSLQRELLPIKSIPAAFIVKSGIGYVKIERFSESTAQEFDHALEVLKSKGMRQLIVDVRGNGGGYLEAAVHVADQFLPAGAVIVSTRKKKGDVKIHKATKEGLFEQGKVHLLIDENSASASEILAGALQDHDRATLYGRRSFGKGLVQNELKFDDQSAVRLTTARYFTPCGRSIQRPYKKGELDDYDQEMERRLARGEFYQASEIPKPDSLKFRTDHGRIVYGGGGIIPDVFVPLETGDAVQDVFILMESGLVGQFVFEYWENHRYPKQWNWDPNQTITDFEQFILRQGIDFPLKSYLPIVMKYLEAEKARFLENETAYFRVLLQKDPYLMIINQH
ncbi:MAG: peptidase S41 [Flavobacterium sp. BFFFF2]|nr:MAG: peptidase S41 [Flavobacterium sp. BFFFF2]